ncbi:FecR family protein [Flagellimonas onchidii]|uniref:FecR family protein n=1 Tax=Flagellimonas onchidii TaxID=2562684 RepID=UPI0010A680E9|nr:FecR domain-containing protein [Allomuricauda onchidii]
MSSKKIEFLIVKYLVKEITSAELDVLNEWIKDSENEKILDEYVKIHYEITAAMNEPDIEAIKKNLRKKIKDEKISSAKTKYLKFFKYAAVFALLFTIGYWHIGPKTIEETNNTEVTNSLLLVPDEESITLQLDDGSIQQISSGGSKTILDADGNIIGSQDGQNIKYMGASKKEELVFNTLTVPKGRRFEVTLSDGSHVFLNSASSLRYPVKFIKGSPREVFIKGEGYFDVTEDTEHPFIVHADDMEINVLGTKFNVTNYPEKDNISTVLVEGSVKLNMKDEQKSSFLEPGFKAEWNRLEKNVVSMKNVDTRIYTAWTEGKLIFRNATFKHIRHTLERHYNVAIINNNEDLDKQRFDATFDIETINEILQTFNISYAIDFKIVDNKAVID